jgi:hypothetical protein
VKSDYLQPGTRNIDAGNNKQKRRKQRTMYKQELADTAALSNNEQVVNFQDGTMQVRYLRPGLSLHVAVDQLEPERGRRVADAVLSIQRHA